jgi:L-alanine-DL-glutamate epimerase-like enolase superfamily enzyme
MKLQELTMEALEIPLKVNFQHATASRSQTESVLVTAATAGGNTGRGEGCPRSYVTGENIESCLRFFEANRNKLLTITSLADLQRWLDFHRTAIDANPAACCAVELALLAVLAAEQSVSVEALLGQPELAGEFHYTAVIGAADPRVFAGQLQQYLQYRFTTFKVKLFGRPEVDQANVATLQQYLRGGEQIRADANNLWSESSQAIAYLQQLDFGFTAVEEPLGKGQLAGCRDIARALGIPVILDESFTRLSDFDGLADQPGEWIVNLRVSKMGGILRSLAIAGEARRRGIRLIIGAQVGETSLLTRAALTVANGCRDILLAQEGAFGTRLLEHDLVDPPLEFGVGGILRV